MTGNVTSVNNATTTSTQTQMRRPCSQLYYNNYFNQAMSGIDDIFVGMNPMDCGGNIFSGVGGGYPGMGMGMGYGPGSEVMNMTQEQYLNYMNRMEDLQIQRQAERKHKIAGSEFYANAGEDSINQAIATLNGAVVRNEQDHVMPLYYKLLAGVRGMAEKNGVHNVTSDQVKAYAGKLYYEKTGKSLPDDIIQNGDGSLWYGFKRGLTFGLLTDNRSADENVAAITGEQESKVSNTNKWLGTIAGSIATVGGVIALAVGILRKVR